jgi:hypothetical protein
VTVESRPDLDPSLHPPPAVLSWVWLTSQFDALGGGSPPVLYSLSTTLVIAFSLWTFASMVSFGVEASPHVQLELSAPREGFMVARWRGCAWLGGWVWQRCMGEWERPGGDRLGFEAKRLTLSPCIAA